MDIGRQHPIHFQGVLGGKIQTGSPQAQPLQVLLPVQPGKLSAVEHQGAAGIALPDHREFCAGLVHQLHGAPVADALLGAVEEQAVLRDHQRQTAVDQQLTGHGLGHVPDLGHGHLKAQGGAGEFQHLGHIHRAGIVDIQAEVAADIQAQLPHGDQQAQIAHQHIGQALLHQLLKACLQPGQFIVMDDPG